MSKPEGSANIAARLISRAVRFRHSGFGIILAFGIREFIW
jgi:hypothetical protein